MERQEDNELSEKSSKVRSQVTPTGSPDRTKSPKKTVVYHEFSPRKKQTFNK